MRDERRFLKYAYRWKDAGPQERLRIEEQRGVSWTTFSGLPGWMPARDSPVDFMHAVFLGKIPSSVASMSLIVLNILGEVKHIVQQILVVGGMLTRRSRNNDPYKKLEEFLASIWWPSAIGRVPSKVDSIYTGYFLI